MPTGKAENTFWAQQRAPQKAGLREWVLQIDKLRSTKEKLLKHGHMSHDDECAQFFQNILEHEATFRDVSVDPEL